MIADRSRSRGPAYRWLTFALVIGLCLLPGPARFSAQEKQEEGGDKKEKKDLPLEPDRTIAFRHRRRIVDLARRGAGRRADRVRAARRPLHAADRRAATATRITSGMTFRHPAALLAGRIEDRLPLGSQRRREHLDREPRRQRSEGDHQGQEHAFLVARVDAGRQVHRRLAFGRAADGHAALAVPRRRRQRRQPHGKRGAAAAEPAGRGVRQGRSLRLLHRAHGGRQRLQPDELPLAARRVRPPDRRELPHERRARQRDAAGALARRPLARLRDALGRADRPARSRSEERRRLVADLSGHPRRPGVRVDARPDARLVVHARFEGADHVVRRQDLARRGSVGRSDADSVHRQGRAEGSDRRCSSSTRSTRDRSARSRFALRACRPTASSSRSPRSIACGSWTIPAASRAASARSDAGEHQPAWSPDGRSIALRHLVRRRRRPRLPRRGRRRNAAEADADRVVLLRPGLLARRPAHRRRARPARGAAGGLLAAGPRRPGDGARVASAARRRGDAHHAVPRQGRARTSRRTRRASTRGKAAAASCRSASTAPTARRTSRSPATRTRTPSRPSNAPAK